jgi:hypothetical protein
MPNSIPASVPARARNVRRHSAGREQFPALPLRAYGRSHELDHVFLNTLHRF